MGGGSNLRPPGEPDEIYVDESDDRGGYDLIGGLWLTAANAQRLRGSIDEVRRHHHHVHEFKWKKPGSSLSGAYRDLATKVTDQIRAGRAGFSCIVLPRQQIDYRTYHEGDRELGYYKFMSLLVRKRFQPGRTYVLRVDRRTQRRGDRLVELKRVLNSCGRKDLGIHYDCCRNVEAVDSKDEPIMQAVDILLGAVGWHCAGSHYNPSSSLGKNTLASRIAAGIGQPHLAFSSPPWERHFNIWRWEPREEGK